MVCGMSEPQDGREAPAGLFEELPVVQEQQVKAAKQARAAALRQGRPRLLQPNRSQVELRASDLESLLGQEHRARLVWGYVERQELSRLIKAIKARGSNAGRSAIDPRILFALWLYATLDGVGSGREIARLTRESDAYRWICGGVSVNYHALNDFRSGNEVLMDEVLTRVRHQTLQVVDLLKPATKNCHYNRLICASCEGSLTLSAARTSAWRGWMVETLLRGAPLSMLTVCRWMRRKSARADSGDSSLPARLRRRRITRYRISVLAPIQN